MPGKGPTGAEQVWEILKQVKYPGLERSIVDLGYVQAVDRGQERWRIRCEIRTSDRAAADAMEREVRSRLDAAGCAYELEVSPAASGSPARATAGQAPLYQDLVPQIRHKILVASGKGGVGKSTVAVNLALALARLGLKTGLLDADVYGPSIPTMLGVSDRRPESRNGKLIPIDVQGISTLSLGFLTTGLDPLIWRGPLASRAIEQLLSDVAWGPLDYLVLDLPPGTGDIQISVAQKANPSGVVIVTTPQDVALIDAIRGVHMFRKVEIAVLGLVENMSYFACPHCHQPSEIFPHGALKLELERLEVPILGRIPIDPAVAAGGDSGAPIVTAAPDSASAAAFRQLAEQVVRLATRSRSAVRQASHDATGSSAPR